MFRKRFVFYFTCDHGLTALFLYRLVVYAECRCRYATQHADAPGLKTSREQSSILCPVTFARILFLSLTRHALLAECVR